MEYVMDFHAANERWINPLLAAVPGVIGWVNGSTRLKSMLLWAAWVFMFIVASLITLGGFIVYYLWVMPSKSSELSEEAQCMVERIGRAEFMKNTNRIAHQGTEFCYGQVLVPVAGVAGGGSGGSPMMEVPLTWRESNAVRSAYIARVKELSAKKRAALRLAGATGNSI